MTTNLKGPLMPPSNHKIFPRCSHFPTLLNNFTPPLSTNLHHLLPTPHSQLSILINLLRILKQSEGSFHKLLLPNHSTYLVNGFEIYFEDDINKNWRYIHCKVLGRERNQRWLLSLYSNITYSARPSLTTFLFFAPPLPSRAHTQSHAHRVSLSLFLFFVLCFFPIPVDTNWNIKHFTPLLSICIPLLKYKLHAGKDFYANSILYIRQIVSTNKTLLKNKMILAWANR